MKNSVVTKYYFAGTTRLAVRTGGTLSYLLGDHIGSSSVTTDANGLQTAQALYKAFGETRYTLGNLSTDYKFTGQREEASLGIYFFNARWYDSSLGRFLSPDTIVPTSTQGTQAWDRYAFVNNNPVRYNDPTGHMRTEGGSGGTSCGEPGQPACGGVGGDKDGESGGGGEDSEDACFGPKFTDVHMPLHPSNFLLHVVIGRIPIYSSDGTLRGYIEVTYAPDANYPPEWDWGATNSFPTWAGFGASTFSSIAEWGLPKLLPKVLGTAALPPVASVGIAIYTGLDLVNRSIVYNEGIVRFTYISLSPVPDVNETIKPMLNPFPLK